MGKITSKAEGILYYPNTISIHMTDICNSRCRFCSEGSHEHMQDLVRKEEILKYLESHDTSVWTAVNIHGGEPTIASGLIEVIEKAKKLGYSYVILQTNAHRIGQDKEFAERLDGSGVDLYNIGFHGSNAGIMDQLTGVEGSFEKAIKGVRRIAGFHKPIRITTVITALNYKDITSIVTLASKEGISHVNISAMQTGGSAVPNLDMLFVSYQEAKPYIMEAVRLAETLGVKITLEGFPFCVLEELEKYQVDWTVQRLKLLYRKMVMDDYNKFLTMTIRTFGEKCENCLKRNVCTGVYKEYVNKQGWDEFHTFK